ncbi:hypothetical protein EMIT043CA1_200054 [Pseudomonas brassicacearum]
MSAGDCPQDFVKISFKEYSETQKAQPGDAAQPNAMVARGFICGSKACSHRCPLSSGVPVA